MHVMHLIQGLEVGGLEIMVINLLRGLDPARFRPSVCCFDSLGPLADELKGAKIPVTLLQRKPGIDWRYILRLARFLNRSAVQILHLHNPTAFFYGTLAGKLARIPYIIYTEHGRDYSAGLKVRLAHRFLAKRVDQIIVVAQSGKRYLCTQEGVAESKIRLIYNGIDGRSFRNGQDGDLKEKLGLKPDQPVIGIVARLDPIKNHALLLQAMVQVIKEQPDAVLLIVGDGPLRNQLHAMAAALGIQGKVQFLGTRTDIPALLKIIDVFVLCSLKEGLSLTLVEACAASKPIVATAVGGNPEVVEDGVNGWLVPSNDAQALAQAILSILGNRERAMQMGQKGYAVYREKFDIRAMVKSYQELYERLSSY